MKGPTPVTVAVSFPVSVTSTARVDGDTVTDGRPGLISHFYDLLNYAQQPYQSLSVEYHLIEHIFYT